MSLAPGQSRQLSGKKAWRIEFHRGGDFGQADLSLARGAYRFAVTRAGWDLLREKDD
jgi:hypothetical protein